MSGGNFLKYAENKENEIFTIDNTIVLKKFTIMKNTMNIVSV